MFWYDGKLNTSENLKLSIADPGLLYGATAFTTLRVYDRSLDGGLTQWEAHCRRVERTVAAFHWSQPDWERVRLGAENMIAAYPVLRLAIFPDGREWITGRELPPDLEERQRRGIGAWIAEGPRYWRSLAHYKTGNYLPCYLALQEAKRRGLSEAILVDESGNWLETATGNLWGWRDGCWYTPPLGAEILPGVMRSHLLETLHAQRQKVCELPWTAQRAREFEAIAYSNSVVEIVPIAAAVGEGRSRSFDPTHGAIAALRQIAGFGRSHPDPA
ncbi:MAG: 4-amino-4-deoxychorismate lyase [Cyanobacteria bacterium J007]|jgi:4-amino-4-deoxychorismate lyase|nr:MAG: 4-amino-4-deoxychorismate lyase [Cyanobacteria bacterium J007]